MAEARLPLPRPWHGASDREDDALIQALRLQRLEVEARLAYCGARDGSAEAVELWHRLAALRERRRALLSEREIAALPALPEAPAALRARAPAGGSGWRRLIGLLGGGKTAPS